MRRPTMRRTHRRGRWPRSSAARTVEPPGERFATAGHGASVRALDEGLARHDDDGMARPQDRPAVLLHVRIRMTVGGLVEGAHANLLAASGERDRDIVRR